MKTLLLVSLFTLSAFGATLEERVTALENNKLEKCHIQNVYRGSYYRFCPVNSYANQVEVNVQINGPFAYTNTYVNCFEPVVICVDGLN